MESIGAIAVNLMNVNNKYQELKIGRWIMLRARESYCVTGNYYFLKVPVKDYQSVC